MKKILLEILKKIFWQIAIIIICIAINMYFLTFPSKILGKIIDLLYDVNKNREIIYNYIFLFLVFVS